MDNKSIPVTYQDWSKNNTESNAWRVACLVLAKPFEEGPDQVEIYMVRKGVKKDTFFISMDVHAAKALRDNLNHLLEE